jgi:hypothetical protein
MKTALQLMLFLLFTTGIKSQNIPTIREIYNFDVNDEFQSIEVTPVYAPSIGYQSIILNKSFSTDSNTVYYTSIENKYSISPGPNPIFTFYSDTVNYSISNLDSLITKNIPHFQVDSCNSYHDTVFTAANYCNHIVYKNTRCLVCCFEGIYYEEIYGVGLGRLKYFRRHAADADILYYLSYFKKGNQYCGTPDPHFTGIENINKSSDIISIFPNPANTEINILIKQNYKLTIFDLSGRILTNKMERYKDNTVFDISFLINGIYFLRIETKDGVYTQKLIKE